ncbi:MAG: NAD(P)H-dependent oxidoreductase [Akkermansiaceae bacterium]
MNPTSPQDLLAQLKWRYATKAFDPDRAIPESTWTAIEDSLVLTPSSFGLQPWHFVIVENKNLRAELLPQSWNQQQVINCSRFVVLAAKTDMGEKEIEAFLQRTIDVRGGELESLSMYRDMMVGFTAGMDPAARLQWAKLQTYIALGQLMASAAALGIDACPMEGINPAEYDRILGLPEKGLATSVACALGYRSADDKYAGAPKVRFEKSELLTRL